MLLGQVPSHIIFIYSSFSAHSPFQYFCIITSMNAAWFLALTYLITDWTKFLLVDGNGLIRLMFWNCNQDVMSILWLSSVLKPFLCQGPAQYSPHCQVNNWQSGPAIFVQGDISKWLNTYFEDKVLLLSLGLIQPYFPNRSVPSLQRGASQLVGLAVYVSPNWFGVLEFYLLAPEELCNFEIL